MFLSAVGRLAPGVDAERATTVVSALASSIVRLPPSRGEPGADVVPLRAYNSLPGTSSSPAGEFATLGAFTLMLLLLTCTNVGTLQIGLAALRRREIGVRLSLGASRARLIRQLLTESGLLALAASALSLGTVGLLVHLFSEYVRDVDVVLAWPVLIFTLGVGLLAAVVFGLSPALQATRISVSETLKVSATWGSSRSWLQRALVVAQVGLTQPLLLFMVALSLLFLRELRAQGDSGLDDRIVSVAFNVFAGASTFETRAEVVQRLQERLTALPAVVSAIPQTVGHPSDGGGCIRRTELRLRDQRPFKSRTSTPLQATSR
jgi:putative ABC transport system permease protein